MLIGDMIFNRERERERASSLDCAEEGERGIELSLSVSVCVCVLGASCASSAYQDQLAPEILQALF